MNVHPTLPRTDNLHHHTPITLNIMRFTALALLALPALAMAAPSTKRENWGKEEKEHDDMKHDDHHEDQHQEKELVKGVFHFTSTYTAWAGPDQV